MLFRIFLLLLVAGPVAAVYRHKVLEVGEYSPAPANTAPVSETNHPKLYVAPDEEEHHKWCVEKCQEKGFCCNDVRIGSSNWMVSCAQACMMRHRGASREELDSHHEGLCLWDHVTNAHCTVSFQGYDYELCSHRCDEGFWDPHCWWSRVDWGCNYGASLTKDTAIGMEQNLACGGKPFRCKCDDGLFYENSEVLRNCKRSENPVESCECEGPNGEWDGPSLLAPELQLPERTLPCGGKAKIRRCYGANREKVSPRLVELYHEIEQGSIASCECTDYSTWTAPPTPCGSADNIAECSCADGKTYTTDVIGTCRQANLVESCACHDGSIWQRLRETSS